MWITLHPRLRPWRFHRTDRMATCGEAGTTDGAEVRMCGDLAYGYGRRTQGPFGSTLGGFTQGVGGIRDLVIGIGGAITSERRDGGRGQFCCDGVRDLRLRIQPVGPGPGCDAA